MIINITAGQAGGYIYFADQINQPLRLRKPRVFFLEVGGCSPPTQQTVSSPAANAPLAIIGAIHQTLTLPQPLSPRKYKPPFDRRADRTGFRNLIV